MVGLLQQQDGQPDTLLSWLEALRDPSRLRLLCLLEQYELGVIDLCDVMQMPQSTVSRHLKILDGQGWICHRRQGTANLYRMVLDELEPAARQLWLLAREQTSNWATLQQDKVRLMHRIEHRQQDTQTFFAGAAAEWDKLRTEFYGRQFTQAALLSLLDPGLVVADLGCGTGSVVVELAEHVKSVIGVDNSSAMLQSARARTAHCTNVELRCGDLEKLPIEDEQCDAALIILVLGYVKDTAIVLSEIARILKPKGRTVIVDLMRHDRDDFRRQTGQERMGFDPPELKQMLKDARLRDATCRALPPQTDATGPALLLATASRGTSH